MMSNPKMPHQGLPFLYFAAARRIHAKKKKKTLGCDDVHLPEVMVSIVISHPATHTYPHLPTLVPFLVPENRLFCSYVQTSRHPYMSLLQVPFLTSEPFPCLPLYAHQQLGVYLTTTLGYAYYLRAIMCAITHSCWLSSASQAGRQPSEPARHPRRATCWP